MYIAALDEMVFKRRRVVRMIRWGSHEIELLPSGERRPFGASTTQPVTLSFVCLEDVTRHRRTLVADVPVRERLCSTHRKFN
jgi:hypothetical protein